MTFSAKCYAVPNLESVFGIVSKLKDVVSMKINSAIPALLTSPVVAGIYRLSPIFVIRTLPYPLALRNLPALPIGGVLANVNFAMCLCPTVDGTIDSLMYMGRVNVKRLTTMLALKGDIGRSGYLSTFVRAETPCADG